MLRKSSEEEKKSRLAEYEECFLNPDVAVHMGYVDEIIEPYKTRERIAAVLSSLDNGIAKKTYDGNMSV